jgi:hypothetical protein
MTTSTAERRGRESLRRFLLDLDAAEANAAEARTIGQILELDLAVSAHPRNQGGLAPTTYKRYEWTIGCHMLDKPRHRLHGVITQPPRYASRLASLPAIRFNQPQAPRAWREDMLTAGVPKSTRDQGMERVLSGPELGRRITVCTGDPNQWLWARQRAAHKSPPLYAPWRQRIRPNRASSRARCSQLGAIPSGC